MSDDHDLQRFVTAQDGGAYDAAVAELSHGRKTGHWMWFVFPQLAGLGRSCTAQHFAISGLDQARAYLAHPVLGSRLRECARLAAAADAPSAEHLVGGVDALKLRSSVTLFARADPAEPVFRQVLERWYGGEPDPATDRLLAGG